MERPRPKPIPLTQPFWQALRDEQVVVQHCDSCGAYIHYPRVRCPECFGTSLSFAHVAGTATLHTFTISRVPTSPHFADDVPQVLAVVDLDGCPGVKMTTTLVGTEGRDLRIGMPLAPVFDHGDDGITLLRFRPK